MDVPIVCKCGNPNLSVLRYFGGWVLRCAICHTKITVFVRYVAQDERELTL